MLARLLGEDVELKMTLRARGLRRPRRRFEATVDGLSHRRGRQGRESQAARQEGTFARAAVVGQSGGPLTVRAWAKSWIETRKVKGIVTADDYDAQLKRYILPVIGDIRIEDVTPEHIGSVLVEIAKRALAPRTVRHIYFTMHAMFRKAVPRLIDANPCSISTPRITPSRFTRTPSGERRPSSVRTSSSRSSRH